MPSDSFFHHIDPTEIPFAVKVQQDLAKAQEKVDEKKHKKRLKDLAELKKKELAAVKAVEKEQKQAADNV